jgi:hypothetical protein
MSATRHPPYFFSAPAILGSCSQPILAVQTAIFEKKVAYKGE